MSMHHRDGEILHGNARPITRGIPPKDLSHVSSRAKFASASAPQRYPEILVDVLSCGQSGAGIDPLWNLLAVEVADHQIDADDPHRVRELQHVGREVAILDRLKTIFRAIESDD